MLRSLQQLNRLLTARQRWAFAALVFGMVLAGLLELVAIGAVPIFIKALTGQSGGIGVPRWLLDAWGADSQRDLAVLGGLMLFGTVLIKNFGTFVVTAFRVYLVKRQQWHLIHRICRTYIDADFEFHLQHASYETMRNANVEIQKVANGVLTPLTLVAMNSIATVAVISILFWQEPVASAVMFGVTALLALVYVAVIRSRVADHAENAQLQRARFHDYFNMIIGSLPEIRILRKEEFFFRKLCESAKITANAQQFHMLGAMAASPYLETVVTGVFVCLIAFLAGESHDPAAAAPTLGLLAIGMLRVRSLTVQILSGVTQIQANHIAVGPVYDHIQLPTFSRQDNHHDLNVSEPDVADNPTAEIVFSSVGYQYPGTEAPTISNLSFSIAKGQLVGICGASGSGKSTMLKLLLGLLKPSSGNFNGFGIDVARNPAAWHPYVGYVPQSVYLLNDTIERNIAFGVPDQEIDHEQVRHAAERAQLTEFIQSLPEGFQSGVGEFGSRLSGGQRQRLGIARALYSRPMVLILDEITSALDPGTEARIVEELLKLKGVCTTFFATHRKGLMSDFDCILELSSEHLTQCSPVRIAG